MRDSNGPVALPYGLLSRLHQVRSRVAPALRQVVYGGRASWTREPNTLPWFDQPDALQHATGDDANLLRAWVRDGYVVVDGLVDPADIDAMVATLDGLWDAPAPVPHLVLLDLRETPDAPPATSGTTRCSPGTAPGGRGCVPHPTGASTASTT